MSNIETLSNIVDDLKTLKSELTKALMRANRKCPECNTPVIFEEGCMKCVACSWNKCD